MLAYIFWHVPLADIVLREYETALLDFHTRPHGNSSCGA